MWCYAGCMQLCGGRVFDEQKGSQQRKLIEMGREGYQASEMAVQKATGFFNARMDNQRGKKQYKRAHIICYAENLKRIKSRGKRGI